MEEELTKLNEDLGEKREARDLLVSDLEEKRTHLVNFETEIEKLEWQTRLLDQNNEILHKVKEEIAERNNEIMDKYGESAENLMIKIRSNLRVSEELQLKGIQNLITSAESNQKELEEVLKSTIESRKSLTT